MNRFIVLIFFLLTSSCIYAQVTLSGQIALDNNLPASGAFVRLVLASDSITTKKFTAADMDGHWVMHDVSFGEYYLIVKYFGCKELKYPVSVQKEDDLTVNLILEQESFLLHGVEVLGKALGITVKGDTIHFNLQQFTDGQDVTLSDVISKLPGLEVTENGAILYGGKEIDKLLIHGKDILNAKHQLALEGIRANQLAEINVIKDFQEKEDVGSSKTKKVALDVRIKKEHLGKWSGQTKALGGYPNRFKSSLSSFSIGEKLATTFFAKANNTAEQVVSVSDYLKIYGQQLTKKLKRFQPDSEILPKSFWVSNSVTKNLDGVLSGALEYNINKKSSIKSNFMVVGLNRTKNSSFFRSYINEFDVQKGVRQSSVNQPIMNISFLSENKFNRHLFVGVGVSVAYENLDERERTQGSYTGAAYAFINDVDRHRVGYYPELKIKYLPTSRMQLELATNFSIEKRKQMLSVSDNSSFLDLSIVPIDSIYYFKQMMGRKLAQINNSMKVRYYLKRGWSMRLGYQSQLAEVDVEYKNPNNLSLYQGVYDNSRNLQTYDVGIELDTLKWWFKAGVTLLNNQLINNGVQFRQPLQYLPYLSMSYTIKKMQSSIDFAANVESNNSLIAKGSSVFEVVNTRLVYDNRIDWMLANSIQNYSLGYISMSQLKGNIFFVQLGYLLSNNALIPNVLIHPTYTQLGEMRAPTQETWFGRANFTNIQVPRLPIRANLDYQVVLIDGLTAINNQIIGLHHYNHSLMVGLKTNWRRDISISASFRSNISGQRFNNIESQFESFIPEIEFGYNKKQFVGKIKVAKDFYLSQDTNLGNWRLNGEMNYKLPSKPIRLLFQGNDVTNLISEKLINVNYNSYFSEREIFSSFPGFIVAGVSWEF